MKMSNNHKFRAYDKSTNTMHYDKPELFGFTTSGRLKAFLCGNELNVMQWTGARDKNGKDVYCDDILRIDGGMGFHKGSDILVIGFFDCRFCTFIQNDHLDITIHDEFLSKCEVIGNTFQNPELL